MTPLTNVIARYRELGSSLEASMQARKESEERGQLHWHRLHERCWCGHLTVPAQHYVYDARGVQTNTQAQAEAAYNKTVKQPVVKQVVLNTTNGACECGNAIKGRGKKCPACYQRAYRERSK